MAFRTILAAVADGAAGVEVLRAGRDIATAARAELVVLRVVDDPWPFIEPGDVETRRAFRDNAWHRTAIPVVTERLEQLAADAVGTIDVTPAVRFGSARWEIARSADTAAADLVILGRPPLDMPPRPDTWAIDGTLRSTRAPCLIVPPGPRGWRRLVVVGDGSIAMGTILAAAFDFAALFRGDVIVVETETEIEGDGRKAFTSWARQPQTGSFDIRLRQGDVVEQTLAAARAERADVLVVGYPRGEGLEGDGVAARVVRHAPCAVLAVPL